MNTVFDAIVLGLGGMGSATAFQLARRGIRVLGLEQFPFMHEFGSSHGHTRIIRTAYYEHPDYIPLVRRAFGLWRMLEAESGTPLLKPCDCLSIGPAGGAMIAGVDLAATRLAPGSVEILKASEILSRFPFCVPEFFTGRLEHEAGFLFVEECVRAHLDAARRHGAELHSEEPVREWKANPSGVEVRTDNSIYRAQKLVITAGAWSTLLLKNLGVPLTVMRQTMQWHVPHEPDQFQRGRFPIFLVESSFGDYYGLPMIDARGVKLARHYGAAELTSPHGVDRAIHESDVQPVQRFIAEHLPGCFSRLSAAQICLYTLTPDRHFVIDLHSDHSNVAVAAGFSGHGFKFAPVVGEMLADLICEQETARPMKLFSAGRFRDSANWPG